MKKIVLIIGVVLLFGMGVLSYFQGWLPFSTSDEDVLSAMIENMSENKTWHSETDIAIETEVEGQTLSVLLDIKEDADRTDPKNPKSNIKFNAELEMEGMSFSLGVEMKVLGQKDVYLRITTIPALPFLDMLGINLDELKDQWIKIDTEYLEGISDDEKNEEMIKQITELFVGKEILIVQEKFANEKIKEINCYHYLVSLDKNELAKIMPEMLSIIMMQNDSSLEYLSKIEKEEALDEMIHNFDGFLDKIGDINFEVWVSKKDKLLYQFEMRKKINVSELYGGDMGVDSNLDIEIRSIFSEFNQEMNIQAPQEFKSLNEVFPTEMFPGQVLGEWI